MVFKLRQNGISGNLLALLENYLSNRQQKVVLNGSSSKYFPLESGVPQGSVLGPLLFQIYINDLEHGILSKIKCLADDTMLYSIVNDPSNTAEELNHDLNVIKNWAYQWKMSFNPDPNKQAVEMLFSQKRIKPRHLPLFFNNIEVNRVSEHKHLGLIFDPKLKFKNHINDKICKAQKLLGVLRLLSSYLPYSTLDQIYKLFIRPHFDYCDVIYHIPTSTNNTDRFSILHPLMESIERVQYHAALIVTGTWKGSSKNDLYDEVGWESMNDRRRCRRLTQFYKIHNRLTPDYLSEKLPANRPLLNG